MKTHCFLILLTGFSLTFSLSAQTERQSFREMALEEVELPKAEPFLEGLRKQGNVLELSLKDAIRLALAHNLEIAIEEYNEELNRQRIIDARGFYDPLLNLRFGWDSQEFPTTSILQAGRGIPTNIFRQFSVSPSLQQNVPGGGSFRIALDNIRSSTNSAFTFVNPVFGSSFNLSFLQPLWRGFLETPTERQLKLYNLDLEISDSQFQQRVSEVVQQVENQYWELVFAIENYETRRQALELAIVQYHNNRRRVEVGVMAPIEVTVARTEVEMRHQDLIQSEIQIIQAQNELKRLLAADANDSIWELNLFPSGRPQLEDVQVTLKEAIRTATERRPELQQIRLEREKNGVQRRYLKREGKPAVNLEVSFGSVGRAGQVFQDILEDRDQDGIPETRVGRAPNLGSPLFGNFTDSLGQAFGFDFINYGVALNVQIPLRNRSNEAQLAQVGLTENQLDNWLKQEEQRILVEVRNAFQALEIQRKRYEAVRVARRLSERQLEGVKKQFETGLVTNFEVLRYQRDLVDAQVRELRTLIDYRLALTALQKAMFTIVDANDIVLARQQ